MSAVRLAGAADLPAILSPYAQLSPGDLLPDAIAAEATWNRMLTSDMMSVHVAEFEVTEKLPLYVRIDFGLTPAARSRVAINPQDDLFGHGQTPGKNYFA
jgi:hypothetical protein